MVQDIAGAPVHTHADVVDAGREVGIAFGSRPLPVPDTSLAQRAVLLYDEDARQRAVAAALFGAHFEHGQNLADLGVVVDAVSMAAEDDAESVLHRLRSGEGEDRLVADHVQASIIGVSSLPTYVAGGRVVLQGDQSIETLRALIAHGRALDAA